MPDELATSSLPTSTFPYHELGPISFHEQNFVETCQTDNYYDPLGRIESVVKQCYNPSTAIILIGGATVLFCAALFAVMKLIAKRSS